MADQTDAPRYPHLAIEREIVQSALRARSGGGRRPYPNRGNRAVFGAALGTAVQKIETDYRAKPQPPPGIDPKLVFRVPIHPDAKSEYVRGQLVERLDAAGIKIVSMERDDAIIAFRDTANLEQFKGQIGVYTRGPRSKRDGTLNKSTVNDIFEFIEPDGMSLWGRADRIGIRLAAEIGSTGDAIDPDKFYVVELDLWHPGTPPQARTLVDGLRQFIENVGQDNGRWLDQYLGSGLSLVKLRARGRVLDQLLNIDLIAEIDLPLTVTFSLPAAKAATIEDFPIPPAPPTDGPRLCIIDSGVVSNHPLLQPYIGHEEAILTSDASPADTNGHGTRVAGLAIYGDVRTCYERKEFASPVTLYSARVLNDRNQFDNETLIITQLTRAVETFIAAPYHCRIFNVSIGGDEPALGVGRRHQSSYGAQLDILSREHQVLFVVAAGNHDEVIGLSHEDLLTARNTYPAQLLTANARINDFATTALGLTVGALAEQDGVDDKSQFSFGRHIAQRNEPAPMTRIGPGVQKAIKPDLVHYGGSYVFGAEPYFRIRAEPGVAVMSLFHQPLNRLFDYGSGTSYAAPRVARLAAILEHRLRQDAINPHPNLLRAILAAVAKVPPEARQIIEANVQNPLGCLHICGYGLPDEQLVSESAERRVVLFNQSVIPLNGFHLYRIPLPESFSQVRGTRRVSVALAFDPPVRPRRLDYLGIEMNFNLFHGLSVAEVEQAYRQRQRDETAEPIKQKWRVGLEPVSQAHGDDACQRRKSTLQCGRAELRLPLRAGYGTEYVLMVSAEQRKGEETREQAYAVAVLLESESAELYNQVRQRIRQRVRVQG